MTFQFLLQNYGIKANQRYSQDQVEFLEKFYISCPYPTKEDKFSICNKVGLSFDQIHNWFLNKRRKEKGKKVCLKFSAK
jgi:hypothetical protein